LGYHQHFLLLLLLPLHQVYRILLLHTAVVQALSCDEGFFDLTGLPSDRCCWCCRFVVLLCCMSLVLLMVYDQAHCDISRLLLMARVLP
jgi:hypothetical protein